MAIDLRWKVPETNKLWVSWKRVNRLGDGKVELIDVEFTGPVTQDYAQLEQTGSIRLDFTNHFIVRVDEFYIVELSWASVKTQELGSIKFDNVLLHDENVGLLDKIKDNDKLLIDCTNQTEEERQAGNYLMVYPSMLYDSLNAPYDFS